MARTTYIGDSLGVGTSQYLPRANTDARVGRSSAEGVRALKRKLRPGDKAVVIDLGSNDPSAAELRKSLRKAKKLIGSRNAVLGLVGPGSPDAAKKNALIKRYAKKHGYAVVGTGPTSDGLHPTNYKRRARQVRRKLRGSKQATVRRAPSSTPDRDSLSVPTSLRELLIRGYSGG